MGPCIQHSCLALLLLLSAPGSQAAIYRWVDAQGQVHFEDRSQAQSASDARSYTPPAAATLEPQQRMDKTRKLLNAYQAERRQAREQQERREQELARRTRQCAIARDRLRQYQHYGGIYRLDDQGERIYLSDQEREELIKRSRDDIARLCS
jgi:capsule polysaccharide export protein KpsE/RkpR